MYTVNDLASATGLTSRQVYDRLSALTPVLADSLQTGQRGAKLVSDAGFAIFRRLVEIEKDGLSRELAVSMIAGELSQAVQNRAEATRKDSEATGKDSELVTELRARIGFLERENERLWGLVDDLKALPSPAASKEEPRRPWIVRLLRPLIAART